MTDKPTVDIASKFAEFDEKHGDQMLRVSSVTRDLVWPLVQDLSKEINLPPVASDDYSQFAPEVLTIPGGTFLVWGVPTPVQHGSDCSWWSAIQVIHCNTFHRKHIQPEPIVSVDVVVERSGDASIKRIGTLTADPEPGASDGKLRMEFLGDPEWDRSKVKARPFKPEYVVKLVCEYLWDHAVLETRPPCLGAIISVLGGREPS